MGEVFLARRESDRQPVAIKMMIPTVATGEKARLYFRRELQVLSSLRHPNIISYYHMFENEGQFQLITEYVDGPDARDWLETWHPERVPVATACCIGIQLLRALQHAHSKGYVHRDIKPSNILVTGDRLRPTVKLSDFGLAKSFRDNAGFTALTHQGEIAGSIGFISPDHIRDFREVKEPADIYSAGATLYFLMSGQYPFLGFDPRKGAAYKMILEHPTVPLRAHRHDVPDGFDRILRKALEKNPAQRWSSAAAMAAALEKYAPASPSHAEGTRVAPERPERVPE
jgi:serine/threonine-protein kinase